MTEKIFFHLLILGGIFSLGIIGILSDEEIGNLSNIIVRNKRVINHEPDGDASTPIEYVPYLIHIRRNGRNLCVGAILSHYSVLTAATCVNLDLNSYEILAGSAYIHRSSFHNLTSRDTFFGHAPHLNHDGIAVVSVDPPFVFNIKVGPIFLYEGPVQSVHTGTMCTVSGWGHCQPLLRATSQNRRLRTITIPIMDHAACVNIYRNYFTVTDKNICIYHPQKACAKTDIGTPLVINNMLAGVHVWKGQNSRTINPDIFINTERPEYLEWIKRQTILI